MKVFTIPAGIQFKSCADFLQKVQSNKTLQKKVNVVRSVVIREVIFETNPTQYWEVLEELSKIYPRTCPWYVTIRPVFSKTTDFPKLSTALQRGKVMRVMSGTTEMQELWVNSVVNSFSVASYADRSPDFPRYRKMLLDLLFKTDILEPLVGTPEATDLAVTCTALSRDGILCNYVDQVLTERESITDTTWVRILEDAQEPALTWSAFFQGAIRHPRSKWITQDLAKLGLCRLMNVGRNALSQEDSLQVFYECLSEAVYGEDPFSPDSVLGFEDAWDEIIYDSRVPMDLVTEFTTQGYQVYLQSLVQKNLGSSTEVQGLARELLKAWSGSPRQLIETVKSALG